MVARDSFVPRLVATLYCSSGLVGSLVGGWVGLGWVGCSCKLQKRTFRVEFSDVQLLVSGQFWDNELLLVYHSIYIYLVSSCSFYRYDNTYIHYIVIHIYIHTYIHTYLHTYIHTYLHTYVRTYIHTYIFQFGIAHFPLYPPQPGWNMV